MIRYISFLILMFVLLSGVFASAEYEQPTSWDKGLHLDYYDLVELSKTPNPKGVLLQKLENQLNTPTVKQPPQAQATFLHEGTLEDFFRVASWNIERGFNAQRIEDILSYSVDPRTNVELKEELSIFSSASVIVLNEVDVGLPRTKYQNIVQRLANTFKMGYVFGTEFIEVDPYQLGEKKFTKEERIFLEDETLKQLDNIDKLHYKGLHGTAILSKYPILDARIIRLPDCYNWYSSELEKLSALELVRRGTAQAVFSAKVLTELRHGGRMAVVTDLLLPNGKTITIVGAHLENRCTPECRFKQFQFLLYRLRNIKNPLILAGDLNTTGTDVSPVTLKKEVLKRVKDPEFIAKQAILSLTPFTLTQNIFFSTANFLRKFKDPTTKNIPLVFPNKERKLFDLITEFRFNDGGAFDIRGVYEKSHRGNYGFLSNSNERDLKGFKPTFELERHFGVAKYKLDWIFVKPEGLKDPNDKKRSCAYAPHFGRTLQELNRSFGEVSDHDPIIVDIVIDSSSPTF